MMKWSFAIHAVLGALLVVPAVSVAGRSVGGQGVRGAGEGALSRQP